MSYLGNTPTTQSFISGTDYFNGTGSQTAFTLTRTVASQNDVEAVVNNVVQQPNAGYTISGTTITFTSAPSAGTQNVYVRYLSTTTQTIATGQGTVGWNQLNSDTQQDLGISFKNRIINGNMVIDQRNAGASITPTSGQYSLDRWYSSLSQTSKFTVQRNAGSVTPPAGFTNYLGVTSSSAYTVGASELFTVAQQIEGFNIADLGWGTANAKTVTLSFWVRSSLTGTFGGVINNDGSSRSYPFTYTISSANTWEYETITIAGDTTGTWGTTNGTGLNLRFGLGVGSSVSGTAGAWSGSTFYGATGATSVVGTNGATFYITGVMLEVGTQATTFTLAGGSYGAELALCQRYYYKVFPQVLSAPLTETGYSVTTTTFNACNKFPVEMRTAPTALEQNGTAANYEVRSTSTVACSAVPTFSLATTYSSTTVLTVASGLTAGYGGFGRAANTTAYLAWSAEL